MRHARLRGRDRGDFAWIEMNAVSEHGARRQHAAFLVNVSVIARAHVKMMDFFELLAVLSQMRLEISFQTRGELGRSAHQFFRTSHCEAGTERVFESPIFSAMPFATKPFAFEERD